MKLLPGLNRHLHRPAACRNLKVRPFDFHGDRSAARVRFLAPGPDIVCHRDHAGLDLNGINQVLRESRFRSRRLSFAVRLDRSAVLTASDLVIPTPRLAEMLLQKRKGLPSQIRARLYAKGMHPGGRLWADAMEFRDWQGRDKGLRLIGQRTRAPTQ